MEMLTEILSLIIGLAGLIGTGISAYKAVKFWIQNLKDKKSTEIWGMVMEMADAAMTEAEKSGKNGADKKAMVIDAIQGSAKAAGIDINEFLDQLDMYIDQTITFVNAMKTTKKATAKAKE